ncbi:DUF488 domain-containing protein [Salipiger aestuarii]|uniref:DUF488 domain-containing protein n=1 Tax=Salipiger aestuarii TaxID=568098 RepID=UPI00123B5BA8|nr:DUF488 family protein [Salipiger aestuarii]
MAKQPDIDIAQVHDESSDTDRARLLVDRIWPRGISKKDLGHDDWLKDIAPTTELRRWFQQDPDKWGEFRNRYLQELADNTVAVERCLAWCRVGPVTLLFAAKDREHNQAVVLREVIAHNGDIPRLRQSTDSPLRTSRGDLGAMALYAGQGVGEIRDIPAAGELLNRIMRQACRSLESMPDAGEFTGAATWKP